MGVHPRRWRRVRCAIGGRANSPTRAEHDRATGWLYGVVLEVWAHRFRGGPMALDRSGETPSAVIAAIDKALQHVVDICTGKERWTMRVPCQPDTDSDCVIADALMEAKKDRK